MNKRCVNGQNCVSVKKNLSPLPTEIREPSRAKDGQCHHCRRESHYIKNDVQSVKSELNLELYDREENLKGKFTMDRFLDNSTKFEDDIDLNRSGPSTGTDLISDRVMAVAIKENDAHALIKLETLALLSDEQKKYLESVLMRVTPSNTPDGKLVDDGKFVGNKENEFLAAYKIAGFGEFDYRFGYSKFHSHEMTSGEDYTKRMYCGDLINDKEASDIFKDKTVDQIAFDMTLVYSVLSKGRENPERDNERVIDMVVNGFGIGEERLTKLSKSKSEGYINALTSSFLSFVSNIDTLRGGSSENPLSEKFHQHIIDTISDKGFQSEKEVMDYLMSNPAELDDFLTNSKVFEKAFDSHFENTEANAKTKARIIDSLEKINKFTTLLDKKWEEAVNKDAKQALINRFGHPVGIPTDKLKPHHFIPGGYLVESGWVDIKSSKEARDNVLDVKLPVDKDGKPDSTVSKWENIKPTAHIRNSGNKIDELSDLTDACVAAEQAWHVIYNRALPHDSLYTAAQLSNVDPNANGASQDGMTGTIRGMDHPLLSGVNIVTGHSLDFATTMKAKVAAVARRLADDRVAPRGVLSLKEIDLSHWRLSRMADNICANEYGVSEVKMFKSAPHNFDKLGRKYHEDIQNEIRDLKEEDGAFLFYNQEEDDFVRPLIGVQRSEAAKLFMQKPGTYLRRAPMSLKNGAPAAFLANIVSPLAPQLAYFDAMTGENRDSNTLTKTPPGRNSLDPLLFCLKANGVLKEGGRDVFRSKPRTENDPNVTVIEKFNGVHAGARGEFLFRRVRFAAKSMGEKATHYGVLDPNLSKNSIESIKNEIDYVKHDATQTKDSPQFNNRLEKALWHRPNLYAKDHELGVIGTGWKLNSGTSEDSKKLALQKMLDGKTATVNSASKDYRTLLVFNHSYTMPVSTLAFLGNYKQTTTVKYPFFNWFKDPASGNPLESKSFSAIEFKPGLRSNSTGLNNIYGLLNVATVRDDVPAFLENFTHATSVPKDGLHKDHMERSFDQDSYGRAVYLNNKFFGMRGGVLPGGIEKTPISFGGGLKLNQGEYQAKRYEFIYEAGMSGAYTNTEGYDRWARTGSTMPRNPFADDTEMNIQVDEMLKDSETRKQSVEKGTYSQKWARMGTAIACFSNPRNYGDTTGTTHFKIIQAVDEATVRANNNTLKSLDKVEKVKAEVFNGNEYGPKRDKLYKEAKEDYDDMKKDPNKRTPEDRYRTAVFYKLQRDLISGRESIDKQLQKAKEVIESRLELARKFKKAK